VWRFSGYHAVFLVSVVLRSLAFPLVSRLREPDSLSLGTMLAHLRVANPLAVTNAAHAMSEAPDEGLRARAAERLGQLESPLAIHELIHALRDPQRVVRRAAADSLGRIGMTEACEPLGRALFDDDSGVGSSAARALGRIGGYGSLKALLGNLNRLDREALDETIESLGHIGDAAAVLPLICLFHDVENRELRRHIATALGRLTQTESVDDVIASLHSGAALEVDPTVVV
jgi:HEAT repeat protein